MKPATASKVEWTTRSGTPMSGVLVRVDPRRPARKRGVALGSWTNDFYRPRGLVDFVHPISGKRASEWINMDRLTNSKGKDNMRDLTCPHCGGDIVGDGYTTPLACENAAEEDLDGLEPDAAVVLCRKEEP